MKFSQLSYIGLEREEDFFEYLHYHGITYVKKDSGDIQIDIDSAVIFLENFKIYLFNKKITQRL